MASSWSSRATFAISLGLVLVGCSLDYSPRPIDPAEVDAVAVEAVEKAGVTLGLGYNRRFHPAVVSP